MFSRIVRALGVAAIVLAVGGCAGGAPAAGSPSASGPAVIQLAVSLPCPTGTTAGCVSVNGEQIMTPTSYEDAAVQSAEAAESNGQGSVLVTFTEEGGKVLAAVSGQAAEAGNGTRLVMKAGDTILGAPVALAALDSREVSIAVPQGGSAQGLVDDILGR